MSYNEIYKIIEEANKTRKDEEKYYIINYTVGGRALFIGNPYEKGAEKIAQGQKEISKYCKLIMKGEAR